MTYRGHIRNGQIALDQPTRLPEGVSVNVEVLDNEKSQVLRQRRMRRIRLEAELAREIAALPVLHPDES